MHLMLNVAGECEMMNTEFKVGRFFSEDYKGETVDKCQTNPFCFLTNNKYYDYDYYSGLPSQFIFWLLSTILLLQSFEQNVELQIPIDSDEKR